MKTFYLYLLIFSSICRVAWAQESITKEISDSLQKTTYEKHQIEKDSSYVNIIDSLWVNTIHQQLYTNKNLSEEKTIQDLFDNPKTTSNIDSEILKERLDSLDKKTPIKITYNKSLESVINYFLKNKREFLEKMMMLSQYYFPMFEEQLDKYNLPLELKYLPIIESALNPKARSRVGASGLWQFMYGTAKMYKLKVTSFTDERYDPILSTEAACQYISQLQGIFGDWALALAAYNTGPGNVSRAIRRSGGSFDFWRIRRYMPRETSSYFPLFVTIMYLFEYADEYGLKTYERKDYNSYQTDTVYVKRKMNFEQIARLTHTDSIDVAFLNPIYKLQAIPANESQPYLLRLPIKSLGHFVSNEKTIYETLKEENVELPTPPEFKGFASPDGIYIVKRGDSLWSIARLFPGVSAKDLLRWNQNVKSSQIKPGMRIKICKVC